jgi:hypothetical protein
MAMKTATEGIGKRAPDKNIPGDIDRAKESALIAYVYARWNGNAEHTAEDLTDSMAGVIIKQLAKDGQYRYQDPNAITSVLIYTSGTQDRAFMAAQDKLYLKHHPQQGAQLSPR